MSETPQTYAACERALKGPLAAIFPILRNEMQRLERENTELRQDKARLDWLKAEPYERLQKVREWLPISCVPPAPDNLRAAVDNAMKHDPNYCP